MLGHTVWLKLTVKSTTSTYSEDGWNSVTELVEGLVGMVLLAVETW